MLFRQLFDRESCTYTYLLADEGTGEGVLIDPVEAMVERDEALLDELGVTLLYTLETHVHADHITSSGLLRQRRGSRSVVSALAGADCADMQVQDGDTIRFGEHVLEARTTPGHTSGCVVYVSDDRRVFTGDTMFIRGCGRTDFQQGSAETLYDSVHSKLFSLPDDTRVYPGHDYKGRTMSTIGEEKAHNPRLKVSNSKEDFIAIMAALKLGLPQKMAVAVPANLRCGLPGPPTEGWAPVRRSEAGVPEVEPEFVASAPAGCRIVDVRQLAEFNDALGHIPGAELAPLDQLDRFAKGWDKDERVVVYCRMGGRSGQAALLLKDLGFAHVVSMAGGMTRWNAEGRPVEGAQGSTAGSCG